MGAVGSGRYSREVRDLAAGLEVRDLAAGLEVRDVAAGLGPAVRTCHLCSRIAAGHGLWSDTAGPSVPELPGHIAADAEPSSFERIAGAFLGGGHTVAGHTTVAGHVTAGRATAGRSTVLLREAATTVAWHRMWNEVDSSEEEFV